MIRTFTAQMVRGDTPQFRVQRREIATSAHALYAKESLNPAHH